MDSRITIKEPPECHIDIRSTTALFGRFWITKYNFWIAECNCGWRTSGLCIHKDKDSIIEAAEGHLKSMDQLRTKEEA